jgi:hypothetical protein
MEFVGLAVTVLSLLYLFFKNQGTQPQRVSEGQEDFEDDDSLQQFLKQMNRNDYPSVPPKAKKQVAKAPKKSSLSLEQQRSQYTEREHRKLKNSIEATRRENQSDERRLSHLQQGTQMGHGAPTRALAAIQHLPKLQDMVIYAEVLGQPRALKPFSWPER